MTLAGCRAPGPIAQQADDAPFKGADVVKPGEETLPAARAASPESRPSRPAVDRFILEQLERLESQVPTVLRLGRPEILWFDGQPGSREGRAVVLLVRNDVYGLPIKRAFDGPGAQVLTDMLAGVGGHVSNGHRVREGHTVHVAPAGQSLAQAAYGVLKSAGLSGRIQNAHRWVIASFRESDDPVEAFRAVYDGLWAMCDALREAQPVLVIGEQVLGEDDLRLRRLYRRASRRLDWPTHAGSAPDPGLQFGPAASGP